MPWTYRPPVVKDMEYTDELIKILNHLWFILQIWKLNWNWWFKYEYWKCPLEHNFVTVQFKCAHKFTYLYQSHISTCLDHMLTNQRSLFKFSKTFETGLSEHHKIISISIKSGSFKHPPKKTKKDLQVL